MHLSPRVVWSLVASLAYLSANHAMADTVDVVEIDLVFPRDKQTYAPAPYTPVVFALYKAERARYIYPYISFRIRDASAFGKG